MGKDTARPGQSEVSLPKAPRRFCPLPVRISPRCAWAWITYTRDLSTPK